MKKILVLFCFIPMLNFGQNFTTENIIYDGHNREYIVYIPQISVGISNLPVLFALHDGSGYADDFMNNEADFRPIADTAGFILVYPQALEDPNDGGSTNWLHKEPTDHKDIFFIETLIDTIYSNYNVDLNRIYACGYSLGGMFSYELACQLNHKITAISSVAGAAFLGAFSFCDIFHPTAVLSINGTDDGIHPYNDQNGWYFSVAAIDSFWSTSNNTDISPIITQIPDIDNSDGSTVERYSWINGDGCVSVEELKITGGGHDWPSPLSFWGNQDINATAEVWNFVSKYDMNGLIGCNSTNHFNINVLNSKILVRIVDVLGRDAMQNIGKTLFYIYNDGTVEKKIVIK